MHARIEKISARELGMRAPTPARKQSWTRREAPVNGRARRHHDVQRALALALLVLVGWFAARDCVPRPQGLHNDFLRQKGESRYSRVISLSATRGVIVDRHNELLAISTPVESVAASPADMQITAEQSSKLARLLEMDVAELRRKIADVKREFVYLKRQLPPEQAAKVVELNVPGVFLIANTSATTPPAKSGAQHRLHHIATGPEALELASSRATANRARGASSRTGAATSSKTSRASGSRSTARS